MSLSNNGRFIGWRQKLLDSGVELRPLWEARSNRAKAAFQDVRCFAVVGTDKPPAIGTILCVDYGPRDGFGLYFQANTVFPEDDVAALKGEVAPNSPEAILSRIEDVLAMPSGSEAFSGPDLAQAMVADIGKLVAKWRTGK